MNDKNSSSHTQKSPLASICCFRGHWPKISQSAFLADGARIIGDVEIGENCGIWFNVVIRGDVNTIAIGHSTNIQDNAVIHATQDTAKTSIGNGVTIGHLALLHGCTVEDYCLIGMHSVVMDGAIVGKESIVGAGAVVTQGTIIPPRSLALGSPAKVVRALKDSEIEALHTSAKRYIDYTKGYDFSASQPTN
jgi:carbonic anhydrase/acetyltransferase-like protein (isoleucine patch superfamily)